MDWNSGLKPYKSLKQSPIAEFLYERMLDYYANFESPVVAIAEYGQCWTTKPEDYYPAEYFN